ncbi:MAG: gamma-glutamylcyclotransferase family protein [Cyanobacteria bacterium J06621_8]
MEFASLPLKVFVYGTLKPGYRNYAVYCEGKVAAATTASTKGNLYSLPMGYPAMTAGNNQVSGVLLAFQDTQVLDSLDHLEGYQQELPLTASEYYRASVPVYDSSGGVIAQAWTYYMTTARVEYYQGVPLNSGCWQG